MPSFHFFVSQWWLILLSCRRHYSALSKACLTSSSSTAWRRCRARTATKCTTRRATGKRGWRRWLCLCSWCRSRKSRRSPCSSRSIAAACCAWLTYSSSCSWRRSRRSRRPHIPPSSRTYSKKNFSRRSITWPACSCSYAASLLFDSKKKREDFAHSTFFRRAFSFTMRADRFCEMQKIRKIISEICRWRTPPWLARTS